MILLQQEGACPMDPKLIPMLLSALYTVLVVVCIAEATNRTPEKKKNSIHLPTALVWIGAICSLIFLIIGWAAALDGEGFGLSLFFGLFALLGMSLMLAWKNHCVSFDKTGFSHRNFLGFTRSFTYDQVTSWEFNVSNPTESHIYVGKKKIPFSISDNASPKFLTKIFDAYRKNHKGEHIPYRSDLQKKKTGNVGFRAHVHNPGEYLGIFIMLLVFFLGLMLWVAVSGMAPVEESDGEPYTVTFDSWSVEKDQFRLHTPQEDLPFVVTPFESYLSNEERLKENCNGKTVFTLWAKYQDPDDGKPYYDILFLSSEGVDYFTFEDATAQKREGAVIVLIFMGACLLFLLLFALLIYLVGRNPKKFPKWVVYACFKKSAIDID